MVRDRDPFGLALSRLREDLRDGRIRPGAPLITTELAAALKISATPVREALSRLAGEGLLDDHRGRGVYALRFGAAEVEDLFRLHGAYIGLALEIRGERPWNEAAELAPDALRLRPAYVLRSRAERFWISLVQGADSDALNRAHQRVTDQLAVVRLVEAVVLADIVLELDTLSRMAAEGAWVSLDAQIQIYHRRRQAAAREIAAVLREPLGGSQI